MATFVNSNREYSGLVDCGEEPKPNPWRDSQPVPALGPHGQVTVGFLDRKQMRRGHPISHGDVPVSYTPEMGIGVARRYKQRGWALYEDVCKGNVSGIDASPEHWKLWSKIAKAYAEGRTLQRGAIEGAALKLGLDSVYHPEVDRRRALADQGGVMSMDTDDFLAYMGFGVDPDGESDIDFDED